MGYRNRTPHQKLKAMVDRLRYLAEKANERGHISGDFVVEGEAIIWAVELMTAALGDRDETLATKMNDAVALWRAVVKSDEDNAEDRRMRRLIGRERAQRVRFTS
jgi:hypothetical protein